MADTDNKKFWFIKLPHNFFNRHDIKIIESMPNGKDYCLFYLKLLLESITHNGELRFNETIPYDENMLSIVTNTNVDVVRSAMAILKQLELIELLDDQTIFMTEVNKMIGVETGSAQRKRLYRERQKLLSGTNGGQCPQELDKELDIDKDIYNCNAYAPEYHDIVSFAKANNIDYKFYFMFYKHLERQEWKLHNGEAVTNWKGLLLSNWNTYLQHQAEYEEKAKDDYIDSSELWFKEQWNKLKEQQ